MSLINVSNLTFCYDNSYDEVFSNVSFQIDTSWRLGLCGRNGRGKTTLLKLLAGKLQFSGTISSSVEFDYFPLSVCDEGDLTLNVLSKIAPNAQHWQIIKEILKLKMDENVPYQPFSLLSGGEKTKALLAAMFLKENKFLLIDEPTNHLDFDARQAVARYLNSKKGFILVSHDRMFLDECVDHILAINKTDIEIIKGNFSTWDEQRRRKECFEQTQNQRLEREVDRLKDSAARAANWSDRAEKSKREPQKSGLKADTGFLGHKAAKLMKKSKVIQKRREDSIEKKSRLLKNLEQTESLKLHPVLYHSEQLLSLSNVCIFYGQRTILEGLSFQLQRGERLALSGANGSGKSSLIKLICGKDIPHSGRVDLGSRLVISYVAQQTEFLQNNLHSYASQWEIDEALFKSILHKLGFSRTQLEGETENLSMGQKKKVLLARSLCERAHLYIWDEPLNYIDVQSRMQIEQLILSYSPTMIFVEHDQAFCRNIATRTLKL